MKMIVRTSALVALALAVSAAPLGAQNPQVEEAVRRVFTSRDYSSEFFGPARWLDNGTAYTTLEPSTEVNGAQDIVRYETATGARTVHVSARRLVPSGDSTALSIEDYAWSADGSKLLIFTNTQRVWRDNTRGDYWVLDLRSGSLRKLGGRDAPESTLMFAKFNPAGDRVAYVRQGDIYVERVGGGITRLTSEGSRTIVNGTTDWVYEEEFGLRDAFRWSPDGRRIAFWQFDMSGVRNFNLINNTDSLYSFVIPVQYPKAGTTNSAVRVAVVEADGGAPRWIPVPGDARNDYLPRMEWTTDSRELVMQRMNRLQNTNQVMLADANTGAVRTILTERDSAWLDVVDDFRWLANGTEFLWVSERDGWRHLYAGKRDGGEPRLLTPGAYDVVAVQEVDETGGFVYFTASPTNATQRYLYRVPLAGGEAVRLSPADQPGTHTYDVSPNGQWAFHGYSTFDTPNTGALIRLPGHEVVRTLVENRALRANVTPVIHRPTEFFRVPVGNGVELDGWMIFPRDFDASKRYPLLMYVYTEPWNQTVVDRWGGRQMLWHRMLADQGYVVASVDNRGTPAPRGRAWRKVVYGSIGELSSREQADAVRALTRTRTYLDPARVAVWGWSGGGSATLNAMFRFPDVYAMGMSVAPVPDMRLYDTVYQERYMGLPQENADGYRRGSPISHAEGLRGDLLLVHGSGDDNVHYQGTQRLMNRLIELGKTFDMMEYPNRSHCICEGQGTTVHVYSLLTRYLLEHLPAGGR